MTESSAEAGQNTPWLCGKGLIAVDLVQPRIGRGKPGILDFHDSFGRHEELGHKGEGLVRIQQCFCSVSAKEWRGWAGLD